MNEEIKVGDFDYSTQRWKKKIIKRKVQNQKRRGSIQQGEIIYKNGTVEVYQGNGQRYWTMFLEDAR